MITLPLTVDLNPSGDIVPTGAGDGGYAENIEYWLILNFFAGYMTIDYLAEGGDDSLDENQIHYIIKNSRKLCR